MPEFIQFRPNIYRLAVPFGGSWTGVTLVRGEKNVLIDSAARAEMWTNIFFPRWKSWG